MADNTTFNAGSGGDTYRSEDRSGVKTAVSLLDVGGTGGTEAIVGDAGVGLPIKGLGTAGTANSAVVTIQGIASMTAVAVSAASLPLPSGAATSAGQSSSNTLLSSIDANIATITTDVASGAVVGNGTAATAQRVTLASDSTGVVAATQSGTWNVGTVTTITSVVHIDDNSGSITVDGSVSISGTVTVGSHAVTNAGTFAVQESGAALTSLQLIDDVVFAEDAAHATADKGIMALAVRRDAAAVSSGTDGDYSTINVDANGRLYVACDTHAVTQSGTWNIGTVTTVTTVSTVTNVATIGTSVTPGTGAAHLGKAEDAAHTSGDTGVMALAVRSNAAASTSGSDGDYQPLITNTTGHLWVDASGQTLTVASHAVTNAGTFAVQAAQSGTWNIATVTTLTGITNVVHVDDNSGSLTVDNGGTFAVQATIAAGATAIAKAEDVASADADVGVPAMAVRKASPANTSGTDGDYEFLQISAGRLWCSATIDAALPAGANAIGKLAANSGVTIGAVEIAAAQTLATVTTVSTVSTLTGGGVAHDGVGTSVNPHLVGAYASAAVPADVSADGDATRLWCLRSGALAVQPTFAGVLATTGNGASGTGVARVTIANDSTGILAGVTTVTTVTTCSTVTTLANGQTAHDGASTGSPLRIGAKAETAISGVTLVSDGDATDLYAGVDGVLIVREHCNLEDQLQDRATNTDGASTAFAGGLAAPGANIRIWLTSVTISNSSAAFCTVDIRDGSAGSVLWTFPVPATGGVTFTFNPPLKFTANTAVAYDASAATSTLTISALGFKSKV